MIRFVAWVDIELTRDKFAITLQELNMVIAVVQFYHSKEVSILSQQPRLRFAEDSRTTDFRLGLVLILIGMASSRQ